jgi:pyruvate kinase
MSKTSPPRQTKLVATLGPASSSEETLAALIAAGVNVCRLNFSHGTHDSHRELIERIRRLSDEADRPVAILQDLCGPKIRVSKLPGDAALTLEAGQQVQLREHHDSSELPPGVIGVSLEGIADDVERGEPILLDDGALEFVVRESSKAKKTVTCQVIHGGVLKPNKGVNFPRTRLRVPSLTEKDKADLAFGLKMRVDFIALSFVRHENDINDLRARVTEAGLDAKLIAKIEKGEAVERSQQIIRASDGIMVARGDLGVEFPIYEVPAIQKRLIREAVMLDRFVITATQMLETMTHNPRPTRAEVSDVANAIYDGTDAVMLSGETAAGRYPIRTVEMMARIARRTDEEIAKGLGAKLTTDLDQTTFADALCHSAYTLACDAGAQLVVAYTGTGRTPLFMSRYRPSPTIIGATDNERVYRRLALIRGVEPLLIPDASTVRELTSVTEAAMVARGLARPGDLTIHVGGENLAARSNINSVRIRRLQQD